MLHQAHQAHQVVAIVQKIVVIERKNQIQIGILMDFLMNYFCSIAVMGEWPWYRCSGVSAFT